MRKILLLLLTVALGAATLSGCSSAGASKKNPEATIEMDDGSKIVIELLPEYAPNTVANFIALANSGFYDGVVFHRIVPGFMVQGGDPDGIGTGGPGHYIKGEFANNGYSKNTLKHTRGVISMARSMIPDSAGSQFFIMVDDADFLDGDYAAFGNVKSGMETVDSIVAGERTGERDDEAVNPRVMSKVTVDTFGQTWAQPEIVAE